MLIAGIYPHGLSLASPGKPKRFVEIYGFAVSGQHLLMHMRIFRLHGLHHEPANAFALVLWMYQHVRIVNNKMAIGYCIAESNEFTADSCRH